MTAVIEVQGLVMSDGATTAVRGVSPWVDEGDILGVVGPDGAGRTATIECLEELRRPDGGTVRVLGPDPYADRRRLRQRIGVQLQQAALPDRIKVWKALDLFASYYRSVPGSVASRMRATPRNGMLTVQSGSRTREAGAAGGDAE